MDDLKDETADPEAEKLEEPDHERQPQRVWSFCEESGNLHVMLVG